VLLLLKGLMSSHAAVLEKRNFFGFVVEWSIHEATNVAERDACLQTHSIFTIVRVRVRFRQQNKVNSLLYRETEYILSGLLLWCITI